MTSNLSRFAVLVAFFHLSGSIAHAAPGFYADPAIQAQAPEAFALQPVSMSFLRELASTAKAERDAFLAALALDPVLVGQLKKYGQLGEADQKAVLLQVFSVEVKSLGIQAPVLVIDTTTIKGPSYFDFDPGVPGSGKVILNPAAIAQIGNPFAGLMLLIHETRHSAQFQLATGGGAAGDLPLARGYRAAFVAQKQLKGKLGFCDFLTLNNELEAFQFGNYVVGALSGWTADTLDMGTYASQFEAGGAPKLDLLSLFAANTPADVLAAFNVLEKDQFDKLH